MVLSLFANALRWSSMTLIPIFAALWLFIPSVLQAHPMLDDQVEALTKQISHAPKEGLLYLKRGERYRVQGQTANALADYATALKLTPHLITVHLCRGQALLEANMPQEALQSLEIYLKKQPENVDAIRLKANTLLKLGSNLAAAKTYDALLPRLEPTGTFTQEAYLNRARALEAAGSAHLERALRGLNEGISRLGPLVPMELEALKLERKLKHYPAALKRIDLELQRGAAKVTWLERRADVLHEAKRTAEALEAYKDVLRELDTLPPSRRITPDQLGLRARVETRLHLLEVDAQ